MLSKLILSALIFFLSISFFTEANVLNAQTLYGSAGSLQNRENAHNADWAYNWANTPNNNPFSVEAVSCTHLTLPTKA